MQNKFFDGKESVTRSDRQTQKLGESFARQLNTRDIICLYGDLGSGKTTFVKGIARGLRITSRIISPTFIIIRQHRIKLNPSTSFRAGSSKLKTLYHIDLYRLDDRKSIEYLGLKELFEDRNAVVVIEWAERFGKMLPKKRWDVRLEFVDDTSRKISFKKEKD